MSDKEETDEAMRFMLARALVRDLGVNHVEARNMVNHWQDETRAEAWDEGFVDGINHDLGDWDNAPAIINNPYRQEKDA